MVKMIENYALHEQIGEGEYGKVFRGIDSRNKKEVAVKVINVKKFKQYPKLEQCTLNQIEVLSKIQSPHIVKFIQILKTANNFYFFYEFCNQGTLEDIIKAKGTLNQSQTLEYLSQILQAFKILSGKNIMHRDLKPSNILINDGLIKIADFGFCKSLQNHRDLAQTMLGSPIYMAPEVLKGQIYTIKADIWSLGVVVYEMLYGFCPFQERSIARLINLLDKQQVVFNQQINKISPAFQDLLKRMLIKDHFKRIGWKQLFQYKVNGVPLLKQYSSSDYKEDKQRQRPFSAESHTHTQHMEQLREVKNFNNILAQRPASRTSFDFNYQDHSGAKSNNTSNQALPSSSTTTSVFKKQSNHNIAKPVSVANKSSSHNTSTTLALGSNPVQSSNKQNLMATLPNEPVSATIRSKVTKNKIKFYLKLAAQVIEWNYCPEVSIQLCVKIYQSLQKEMNKMEQNGVIYSSQQKLTLSQVIKQFLEQSIKGQKLTVSGPLLNYYIKSLQISHKDSFQSTNPNKDILIHCLCLLDLNDLSIKQKSTQYTGFSKQKLISELYQKIIRNTI